MCILYDVLRIATIYRSRQRRRTELGVRLSKLCGVSSVLEMSGEWNDVRKMYNVCNVYFQCTRRIVYKVTMYALTVYIVYNVDDVDNV